MGVLHRWGYSMVGGIASYCIGGAYCISEGIV